MNTYQPVPVSAAKAIAEQFAKSQVLIIASDPVHDCLHHTTYGVSPQDKVDVAAFSEAVNHMLTGGAKLKTFEDFRAMPAAEAKAKIDRLEHALAEAMKHPGVAEICAFNEGQRIVLMADVRPLLDACEDLEPAHSNLCECSICDSFVALKQAAADFIAQHATPACNPPASAPAVSSTAPCSDTLRPTG